MRRLYFPELDGLRFFAFLLVFMHHQTLSATTPYLSIFHTHGWIGVDLFFTLSAFLFTKLLIAEFNNTNGISFKKFYLRRIFRIWPIYFLYVGFCIALHVLTEGSIDSLKNRIIGLLTFTDNLMAALQGYNRLPYTGHLWTISYEEQFYLFIPIIILLLIRSSFKKRLACAILIFLLFNGVKIALVANHVPHPAIWVLPVAHFESIVLGIVIGFGGFDFLLKRIHPLMIGVMGLFFFVLVCLLPRIGNISYWSIAFYACVGLSTSMVLFSVLNSVYLKTLLSKKVFVFLGKRSYGLYVYHQLANAIVFYLITRISETPPNALVLFTATLSVTIIMSVISYKVVETPFLKLKSRFEVIFSRPV